MASATAQPCTSAPYRRRHPERTPLYGIVQEWLATYLEPGRQEDWDGDAVPAYVEREFRRFLECGILACGFARAYCNACGHDFLVAFSCKGRGVCPSCMARRMAETAAHLVDHVFPSLPVRQWVISFPPDRPGALPPRRTVTSPQALLRTDHASFPASGSSISKAPIKEPVTSRWSSAWSCR
jgi:hypothetical protein